MQNWLSKSLRNQEFKKKFHKLTIWKEHEPNQLNKVQQIKTFQTTHATNLKSITIGGL